MEGHFLSHYQSAPTVHHRPFSDPSLRYPEVQPFHPYSGPSSVHSSPRSFHSDMDLDLHFPSASYSSPRGASVSLPYSVPSHLSVPSQVAYSPRTTRKGINTYPGAGPLKVSTLQPAPLQPDPSEYTARPGNAQVHAQFHTQSSSQVIQTPTQLKPLQMQSDHHVSPPNPPVRSTPLQIELSSDGQESSQTESHSQRESPDLKPNSDLSFASSISSLTQGLSRPLTQLEQQRLADLDRLKFFLATAPSRWDPNSAAAATASSSTELSALNPTFSTSSYSSEQPLLNLHPPPGHTHPALNRFLLPTKEYVTCILWGGLYHITGTDIVRALVFRFEAFGRPVRNMKKFEEGVFSDLRNLKPGVDACLEEPKSPFLDLLFKYQCIRTQKKQKVFYWFSVPHDRLFLDALERDLKRELAGFEATTVVTGEPAMSFTYDSSKSLYEQFSKATGARDGEDELEAAVRRVDEAIGTSSKGDDAIVHHEAARESSAEVSTSGSDPDDSPHNASNYKSSEDGSRRPPVLHGPGSPFFAMFSLFEGSPSYKQRRKRGSRSSGLLGTGVIKGDPEERGRFSTRFSSGDRARHHSSSKSHDRYSDLEEQDSMTDYAAKREEMSAADMFIAQSQRDLNDTKMLNVERRSQSLADAARLRKLPTIHHTAQYHAPEEPVYFNEYEGPTYVLPPADSAPTIGAMEGVHSMVRTRSQDVIQRNQYSPNVSTQYSTLPVTQLSPELNSTHIPTNAANVHSSLNPLKPDPSYFNDGVPSKTKTFACPVMSCGRLFKRMEHLKRHQRTHTQERPFQCNKCGKKFSRSDNLTQHLRTHVHVDDNGYHGGGNVYEGGGARGEWDCEREYDEGGDSVGMDSDDFEEVDSEAQSLKCGMPAIGHDASFFGEAFRSNGGDINMTEDLDLQHKEDGFISTSGVLHSDYPDVQAQGQVLYYNPDHLADSVAGTFQLESQWSARPHQSPAFSTMSVPSPPGSSTFHHRDGRPSSSSSDSSIFAGGPGPIRRYRSMTPSLMKGIDNIRRPMTATGADFSSMSSSNSVGRGYHPYFGGVNYGSRGGSAHSSPSTHSTSLDWAASQPAMLHTQSHQSSADNGHDSLAQIANTSLEQVGDSDMYNVGPSSDYGVMYRTDSPQPFTMAPTQIEAPVATYTSEPPYAYTTELPISHGYANDSYCDPVSQLEKHGMWSVDDAVNIYPTLAEPQHVPL